LDMDRISSCGLCGQDFAKYVCRLCGADVCEKDFVKKKGICIACYQGKS